MIFTGFSNMHLKGVQHKRLKLLSRGLKAKSVPVHNYKRLLGPTNPAPTTEDFVSDKETYETYWNNSIQRTSVIKVLRTQIGFLKVHKAASTTVQAIFLRFGWKRNLTFVLPHEFNHFRFPNIISTYDPPHRNNTLPPPANKSFDILSHHVLYDKEAWDKVLPVGYALIGSVREPWDLFKSMINYMTPRYITRIKSKDKIATFLQHPLKYEPNYIELSWTNNRMSVEFGVHPDIIITRDFKRFQDFLRKIDQDFDLVIIADLLDESLILLRRLLSWSLQDILYVSKNVRKLNGTAKYIPTKHILEKFKAHCAFDYLLYDFFKRKLQNQILVEGPLFSSEVKQFKEIRKTVENFCKTLQKDVSFVKVHRSEWNPEFLVDRKECGLLLKNEITFTQEIRKRQYGSATWTWPKKLRKKSTFSKSVG